MNTIRLEKNSREREKLLGNVLNLFVLSVAHAVDFGGETSSLLG